MAGPTSGNTRLTLHGHRLHGTRHSCRFSAASAASAAAAPAAPDELVVPATFVPYDGSIVCVTPPLSRLPEGLASSVSAALPLHLRVSVNGHQYGQDSLPFLYFSNASRVTHRLRPASGPTDGGTAISFGLVGINATHAASIQLGGLAQCRLNGCSVPATIRTDGLEVRCVTPPSEAATDAILSLTLDGGQSTLLAASDDRDTSLAYGGSSPSLFHYYTQPSMRTLDPLHGPHLRGASVTVLLDPPVPLAAASGTICRWGHLGGGAGATTLGVLIPDRAAELHRAAAGVVYAPRNLSRVVDHPTVPHVLASHAVYDGQHLIDRFIARGLPPSMADGVEYDADPIDAEGADRVRGTPSRYEADGTKFDVQHYAFARGENDASLGRDEWQAASTVLQWYFRGRGTCVGFGPPDDFCNSTQLVCAGPHAEEFGNYDEQASAAVVAILSPGGVHPDCPSLHRFDGASDDGAAAWLHTGAGDWHHSTVVDRGSLPITTPSDGRDAWRAYLSNQLATQVNCTAPSSLATQGSWQSVSFDFTCESTAECAAKAAAEGWRLGGTAEVRGGQLRLTRAGTNALSATSIGHENMLQSVLPSAEDPTRPDSFHASGQAIFVGLPAGSHRLHLKLDFVVVIGKAAGTGVGAGVVAGMVSPDGGEGLRSRMAAGCPPRAWASWEAGSACACSSSLGASGGAGRTADGST